MCSVFAGAGAANRGRTGTEFLPKDFKSFVSAYSTIAAMRCFGPPHEIIAAGYRLMIQCTPEKVNKPMGFSAVFFL